MIASDQEPRLPGAGGQQHRPGVGDACPFAITQRIAGQTETEGHLGVLGITAARFLEHLARPRVVAQTMAHRSQPEPGQGLGAGQIDRGLVAQQRFPGVPLRLGLPAAFEQALRLGRHR